MIFYGISKFPDFNLKSNSPIFCKYRLEPNFDKPQVSLGTIFYYASKINWMLLFPSI